MISEIFAMPENLREKMKILLKPLDKIADKDTKGLAIVVKIHGRRYLVWL